MIVTKLKASLLSSVRTKLTAEQGGVCGLCKLKLDPADAVLDHDHRSGAVRGALHRGCNSLLGKVENNAARYGVAGRLAAFCHGLGPYIQRHSTNITGLLHPKHKTEEEKRLARNKKARTQRAVAKGNA